VAPLAVLAEYLLPFVRVGGTMLAWKGPSAPEELEAAGGAIRRLGGDGARIHTYAINDEFCNMQLVTCDKVRPTSAPYPRKAGKPAKDPLK
jgi:16S rRNA (guanine527-N7)-methyltransferase